MIASMFSIVAVPLLGDLTAILWVSLAKAHTDPGDGRRFRDALAACLDPGYTSPAGGASLRLSVVS